MDIDKNEILIRNIIENLTNGDPIKERWIYKFLHEKIIDSKNSTSLSEYCKQMERDNKIDMILS